LVDKRIERTVLVIGRAEKTQAKMRLSLKALLQCRSEARFTQPGFARDQHNLAIAGLGAYPSPQQQVDFFIAAYQRGQRRSAQCLDPACDGARAQHLPGRYRYGDALDLDSAEVAILEKIANQPARARGDDYGAGLGQGLQSGGEVGRLTDHRLLLRRSFSDQI